MSPTLLIVLAAVFGFALLMIVHELGHHLVARAFNMRVLRFSIGFGPAIWKHQPKGSETVYQVALLPFLAYVQIDGMNPFEEVDPEDRGSYANAPLVGRVLTVVAGPLANYLFASILYFATMILGGRMVPTTVVDVQDKGAAAESTMVDGDKIVSIGETPIESFEQMRQLILHSPNQPLKFGVLRNGKRESVVITPRPLGPDGGGLIGVAPVPKHVEVGGQEAVEFAARQPALVIARSLDALGNLLIDFVKGRKSDVRLSGPIGIASEMGNAAGRGLESYLYFLGFLSASLCGFNLLPAPALDGGRLVFLLYEAAARRKPNARIEALIHAVGLLMFLALMLLVSVFDIRDY